MAGEPSQPSSPIIGHGQDILQACLRSGEAFDKAMRKGDPLIKEALAAFEPVGEMRVEPLSPHTATPSQPISPLPEGLRKMQEAHDKSLPMGQDPQMQPALVRFRTLADEIETQREI